MLNFISQKLKIFTQTDILRQNKIFYPFMDKVLICEKKERNIVENEADNISDNCINRKTSSPVL